MSSISLNSRRWLVLALAVVMQAVIIGTASYSFAFFVVPWMQEFGTSRGVLMIAATGSALGSALVSLAFGHLQDRFSNRFLVLAGAAAFALGLVVIAAAPTSLVIILMFVLVLPFGMVLAGTLMASSLVAKSFDKGRGMALGISALGTSLGGFVLPLLITRILDAYEWRTLFVVLAVLVVLLIMFPAAVILRQEGTNADRSRGAARAGPKFNVMASPAVLKLGVAFLVPSFVFLAVLQNLGSLATDLTISQERAAGIVSAASVAMVVAKVAFGALCDRMAHWLLYLCVLAIQGVGLVTLTVSSTFWPLFFAVILICVGTAGNLPVVTAFAASAWGPERFGRMIGGVFAMAGIAGAGALFAGVVRDLTGSYVPAFAGLLLVLMPAAWSFLTLARTAPDLSQTPPDELA